MSTTTTSTTTIEQLTQNVGRAERMGENTQNIEQRTPTTTDSIINLFNNDTYPDEISFELTPSLQNNLDFAQNTGFLPFVWYGSYQISYRDINYFLLTYKNNIPFVKIDFIDSLGLMKNKLMPVDNTKIKVFLNSRNPYLKPIFLQFKIVSFSFDDDSYMLSGSLDINDLYISEFRSYSKMTSHMSLQTICKNLKLGFNTNINDTNDSMTWINTGSKVYDFINQIVSTSYLSDSSFLSGYVDFYYNFNYIDIEKEIRRDISNDVSFSKFGLEDTTGIVTKKNKVSPVFISNDETQANTNNFISEYRLINNSTKISLEDGYFTRIKYYNELEKEILVFDVDSISSSDANKIIPKSPNDEDFYLKNVDLDYVGKMDTDNVHLNYNYAVVQNNRNLTEMEKFSMLVTLPNPNYNFYKFKKISVIITETAQTPSSPTVNSRLSGDWIITNIYFEMDGGSFSQKMILSKRDLDLGQNEIAQ
jgi:hypothetical protein